MKNFKIFTVAMLFLAGATTTFTSCGGEEKAEEKTEAKEEVAVDTAVVEEDNTADCVGDYFGLESDLRDIFLANVQNGAIKIGKTTKAEMEKLTGSTDTFSKEYEGLRVSGYYTFEGDVLQGINLDYFYECEGALSLLDMDKSNITSAVNTTLGVDGVSEGDYEGAGTNWSVNGMNVRQANYSDGYGVYFKAL